MPAIGRRRALRLFGQPGTAGIRSTRSGANLPRTSRPRPPDVTDRNQRYHDPPRVGRPNGRATQGRRPRDLRTTRRGARRPPRRRCALRNRAGSYGRPGRQQPRRHSTYSARRSLVRSLRHRTRDTRQINHKAARLRRVSKIPWNARVLHGRHDRRRMEPSTHRPRQTDIYTRSRR